MMQMVKVFREDPGLKKGGGRLIVNAEHAFTARFSKSTTMEVA